MAGSSFGNIFKMSTWGESHGKGTGVVVDGCPAGLALDEARIQAYLDRRKPGQTKYSTPRKEEDTVEILSGIFEGKTTGTPISMAVYNKTQRSGDYSLLRSVTGLDMLIIHLTRNMVSGITGVAAALLDVRLLAGLRQVQLQKKFLRNWELTCMHILNQYVA